MTAKVRIEGRSHCNVKKKLHVIGETRGRDTETQRHIETIKTRQEHNRGTTETQ